MPIFVCQFVFVYPGLPPLHLTQRAGHVQLELLADWKVACTEEDLPALLPLYGVVVVICVKGEGISPPIAHLLEAILR
jgi:hypothetical protein